MPITRPDVAGVFDVAFREFRRYAGNGGVAALPIGDPSSGVHSAAKSEIRAVGAAIDAALDPTLDDIDGAAATVLDSVAGAAAAQTAAEAAAAEATAFGTSGLSLVSDGARRVFYHLGSGKYIGPTGLETLIADGVDVRGVAGPTAALNEVFAPNANYTVLTGVIAWNTDSIPQITDGVEILNVAFTPTVTNSQVEIEVLVPAALDAADNAVVAAVFRGSTANAIGSDAGFCGVAGGLAKAVMRFRVTSGTAGTPITFRVRAGPRQTGSIYLNGNSVGRRMGGTLQASLRCREIL